jgi:SulP family sulfate permease
MAALIGVMIMVSFETFDFSSLKTLRTMPLNEAIIMPSTAVVTLLTHDLAKGVLAGVILSTLMFGWRLAQTRVAVSVDRDGITLYALSGQLFFGSASNFVNLFAYNADPHGIVVDFSRSHVWDHAAAIAIAKVVAKYHRLGKSVTLVGLNSDSYQALRRADVPENVICMDDVTLAT